MAGVTIRREVWTQAHTHEERRVKVKAEIRRLVCKPSDTKGLQPSPEAQREGGRPGSVSASGEVMSAVPSWISGLQSGETTRSCGVRPPAYGMWFGGPRMRLRRPAGLPQGSRLQRLGLLPGAASWETHGLCVLGICFQASFARKHLQKQRGKPTKTNQPNNYSNNKNKPKETATGLLLICVLPRRVAARGAFSLVAPMLSPAEAPRTFGKASPWPACPCLLA